MAGRHSAADVSLVIEEVIWKFLAKKVLAYFLSDSAAGTQNMRLEARQSVNIYEHYLRKNFWSTKLSLSLAVFTTWILAYFGWNVKKAILYAM